MRQEGTNLLRYLHNALCAFISRRDVRGFDRQHRRREFTPAGKSLSLTLTRGLGLFPTLAHSPLGLLALLGTSAQTGLTRIRFLFTRGRSALFLLLAPTLFLTRFLPLLLTGLVTGLVAGLLALFLAGLLTFLLAWLLPLTLAGLLPLPTFFFALVSSLTLLLSGLLTLALLLAFTARGTFLPVLTLAGLVLLLFLAAGGTVLILGFP